MRQFMDKDFLLTNDTAKYLYHKIAKKCHIIDYHCHIDPKAIAIDQQFNNITQLWLGGDHYKWRVMRANGIDEKYITGDGDDYTKFYYWAKTLTKCIGNPLYHWSHLELKRYFGYDGILNEQTAEEVYKLCNLKLQTKEMSTRNIILNSNVDLLCTTDDPIDDLNWHKQIKEDNTFPVIVLPAFRPDKAVNIEKDDYLDYLRKLENVSGFKITNFEFLILALSNRIEYFNQFGCKTCDHALEYIMYKPTNITVINTIFDKRQNNIKLSTLEIEQFKTALLQRLAKIYHDLDWVMQLHLGSLRNNNSIMFDKLGPDTGYDCLNDRFSAKAMVDFLDALNSSDALPKTVLYSLNPNDSTMITSIMGCFENADTTMKIQHGSAWWFNDHKQGITQQLTNLANTGVLGNFIGMLTDSRSFISYPRHEYFRRILCNMLGEWVENGEYPNDIATLSKLVKDISYNNVKTYFDFDI